MANNTGNPIGSTAAKDLSDNAENLDKLLNGEAYEYTDRLGRERKSLKWMEDAALAIPAIEAADRSEAEAGRSESARSGAEAARDSALALSGIYADTTAGLSATTSDKVFGVPVANDPSSVILYKNQAGVAVDTGARLPSTKALDVIQKTNLAAFAVGDGDGNLAIFMAKTARVDLQASLKVDEVGNLSTPTFKATNKILRKQFAVGDDDGNIALYVDEQGRLVGDFSLAPIPKTFKVLGLFDYGINHIFTYGQSLSVGQATPAISTVQKYDNLMFVRGMRPQYDYPSESSAQWYASLVPAVEAQSPENVTLAETPCTGTGDMIKERILAEDGLSYTDMNYQILLSAPGYGATTIAQLSKGGVHFSRMVEQAIYGLALANAAGKTYAVQAVTWTQGESDYIIGTSQAAYTALLNTLVADINTDLKSASGQPKAIPLISYQLASHKVNGRSVPNIALALLDVEAANPLVYMSTPMYHFDYQDNNNNHLTNVSERWLAAYHGLACKRVEVDRVDWKPLKPLSSIKQGAIAVVKFHVPAGRLTIDTDNVTANTNYGFELVDSTGSQLTINTVSIMGPDTVKIVAASAIPVGAKLRYAWSGSGNVGRTVGPRGNLRDTQGDTIVFDPLGINKPMHNWCVIFELVI